MDLSSRTLRTNQSANYLKKKIKEKKKGRKLSILLLGRMLPSACCDLGMVLSKAMPPSRLSKPCTAVSLPGFLPFLLPAEFWRGELEVQKAKIMGLHENNLLKTAIR